MLNGAYTNHNIQMLEDDVKYIHQMVCGINTIAHIKYEPRYTQEFAQNMQIFFLRKKQTKQAQINLNLLN